MPLPKVIVFDVNETLLELSALKESIAAVLQGKGDLTRLWFSTMLHHSLIETITGSYHGFGEIGAASLMMVAQGQGIELSHEDARSAILTPFTKLRPHPEVAQSLKDLSQAGYRLVSLTNSSAQISEASLTHAGIADQLEKRYSVETVKKYKPHPDTYRMVIDDMGIAPEQAMMVAAHAWDLAGAKNVGMQTAFIARPGMALYPNVARPDLVVNNLTELTTSLKKMD